MAAAGTPIYPSFEQRWTQGVPEPAFYPCDFDIHSAEALTFVVRNACQQLHRTRTKPLTNGEIPYELRQTLGARMTLLDVFHRSCSL